MSRVFHVLTLFPEFFEGPLSCSILGRARAAGRIEVHLHQLRDWATDRHRTVDDYPFGGGSGMVLKPGPLVAAIRDLKRRFDPHVVLLSAAGLPFRQARARAFARLERPLLLVCGRYEGVDERVVELVVDEELSVGDFVVTGGEIPALAVIDAVARLLPGVLGDDASSQEESFSEGLLEYPQYTRPREFEGREVPEVLLSGHHAEIARWRRRASLRRTLERRPELLEGAPLTEEDRAYLAQLGWRPRG
ncbi:MAG: tRNA (guanosine(37)-N1)-methyltransferase TrmD [Nitrospirae bacterium]|nr:MAG: tRNA (guanosine(37)-N1)-methyltransferase TrmD [Nitrospirota bacterium]